jgi:hypothetical protein
MSRCVQTIPSRRVKARQDCWTHGKHAACAGLAAPVEFVVYDDNDESVGHERAQLGGARRGAFSPDDAC